MERDDLTEEHVYSAILLNRHFTVMEREYFKHTKESEAILASLYFKYVRSPGDLDLKLDPEDAEMLDRAFIRFARNVVATSAGSSARNSAFGYRSNSIDLETTFLLMIYFT